MFFGTLPNIKKIKIENVMIIKDAEENVKILLSNLL